MTWQGGRLHLPLQCTWNRPQGGRVATPALEMTFHFGQPIAHLAKHAQRAGGARSSAGAPSATRTGCAGLELLHRRDSARWRRSSTENRRRLHALRRRDPHRDEIATRACRSSGAIEQQVLQESRWRNESSRQPGAGRAVAAGRSAAGAGARAVPAPVPAVPGDARERRPWTRRPRQLACPRLHRPDAERGRAGPARRRGQRAVLYRPRGRPRQSISTARCTWPSASWALP